MGIWLLELKQRIRPFALWMLGMCFLMYVGMLEFDAIEATPDLMGKLFDAWPKVVIATFGMVGLDISTLSGYFACMWFYAALSIALYGLGLGVRLTTLEINDKNADFVYSKPVSRVRVLVCKGCAHVVYLALFALIVYVYSVLGIARFEKNGTIHAEILLFCGALVFIALVYYGIGALAGALNPKKGGLVTYLVFLATYVLGIFYDIATKGQSLIRALAPIKYFDPPQIIETTSYATGYLVLSIVLPVVFLVAAGTVMSRKDL